MYTNVDYGFSVRIPPGLVGLGPLPPNPNHGVRIPLSEGPDDWIRAFSEYAAAEQPPPLRGRFASASPGEEEAEAEKTHLAGLHALRRIWRERRGSDGTIVVQETIRATGRTGDVPIEYSIWLSTTESLFKDREKLFKQVVESFKLVPIRRGRG